MALPGVATGYLQSMILGHDLVTQDLATWAKPHAVSLLHYTDDIMLTSNCFADLEAAIHSLKKALLAWEAAVSTKSRVLAVCQIIGCYLVR